VRREARSNKTKESHEIARRRHAVVACSFQRTSPKRIANVDNASGSGRIAQWLRLFEGDPFRPGSAKKIARAERRRGLRDDNRESWGRRAAGSASALHPLISTFPRRPIEKASRWRRPSCAQQPCIKGVAKRANGAPGQVRYLGAAIKSGAGGNASDPAGASIRLGLIENSCLGR
jgi:hypothetical protein